MTDFLEVVEGSHTLNPKIFSLARLELLGVLVALGEDGATFTNFKVLDLSDGALHSNLKALKEMGYVNEDKVELNKKELTRYKVTRSGAEEFFRAKEWLKKFVEVF